MSADPEERKLAAIMFTDMVGYSALSQRDDKLALELLEEHRQLLRQIFLRFHGTEIKTIGDAFLVEFNSALEAAQCAIEIQRSLAHRNADALPDRRIEVRIGIHIGDVVHRAGDVYGDGVNIASRIEQLANAGGVCVSMDVERQIRNVVETRFEKLAPTELKNIYLPMDLFRIVLPWERPGTPVAKTQAPTKSTFPKWAMTGAVVVLIVIGFFFWSKHTPTISAAPVKSIAVLPFENLSEEKANAFFADGVQDEILTDLARIADLKVISRTSVMQYKSGMARNLREIGQQLGVANVLEGSVQRSGDRIRVNAQLVDARTDRHLWGQTYDRDLADVFAIQSEIAKTIADQLQAKLSPREKNAIERHPTSDISAFDLYTRAKNILLRTAFIGKADLLEAVDLLNQAVARDPSFFDAHYQLAFAHDALYFFGYDHTSARLALAEAALQAASRLRPDAGETHLARGRNLYWAYGDYDGALAELEVARQTLHSDARMFELMGVIQRRQGHWEESTRNLERVVELNPRDIGTLVLGVAGNYSLLRRYTDAKAWSARALVFEPNDAFTKVWLAYLDFDWKADTQPLHQTIDSIRATNPAAVPSIAHFWLYCALAERDAAAAKDALMAFGEGQIHFSDTVLFNHPFAEGVIARITKDDEKARSAFTAARAEQEKIVQAQPNYGPALCVLGLIDAA